MRRITSIDRAERRRLQKIVQGSSDKRLSRRTAILLKAARSTVNRWCQQYEEDGIDGLKDLPQGKPSYLPADAIAKILYMLVEVTPQVLGYQRSRWSTELLSLVLKKHANIKVHSSTLRRWLPKLGIVWRRAAPTLRIKDPNKEDKLAAINDALSQCSAAHPVFYEEEVDIYLNPKIGADWSLRGKQKQVITPGQNKKYYLAGALHAGTGKNHGVRVVDLTCPYNLLTFCLHHETKCLWGGQFVVRFVA